MTISTAFVLAPVIAKELGNAAFTTVTGVDLPLSLSDIAEGLVKKQIRKGVDILQALNLLIILRAE